jgi:predicted enzyme related to lactoylglutathione lyase
MAVKRLAFIMYPVTDMQRAAAFYRDVLGLLQTDPVGEAGKANRWIEFDVDGSTFGIGDFEQAGKPGAAESLALEVDDLSALRERLSENGVESSEPYETPICWITAINDPDGNRIYLHQSKNSLSSTPR